MRNISKSNKNYNIFKLILTLVGWARSLICGILRFHEAVIVLSLFCGRKWLINIIPGDGRRTRFWSVQIIHGRALDEITYNQEFLKCSTKTSLHHVQWKLHQKYLDILSRISVLRWCVANIIQQLKYPYPTLFQKSRVRLRWIVESIKCIHPPFFYNLTISNEKSFQFLRFIMFLTFL